MPIIQAIDRKRDPYKQTLYHRGQGFSNIKKIPKAYLTREGGFIDLSSIVNAGKTAIDFVKNNKDIIQAGASTIGKVVDLGKSISDTVKVSKELEKVKELRETNRKNKKEYIMTPEQEARLKSIGKEGSGFATFSKK